MRLFTAIGEVIAIIVALVSIVERPGDGKQKRADVVRLFLDEADKHLNLPAWAESLFLRESFIGWLVDVIVWAANSFGFFERSNGGENGSGTSQSGASTASA